MDAPVVLPGANAAEEGAPLLSTSAAVNSDKVLKAFQLGVLGREFKVAPKRQLKFVDS